MRPGSKLRAGRVSQAAGRVDLAQHVLDVGVGELLLVGLLPAVVDDDRRPAVAQIQLAVLDARDRAGIALDEDLQLRLEAGIGRLGRAGAGPQRQRDEERGAGAAHHCTDTLTKFG